MIKLTTTQVLPLIIFLATTIIMISVSNYRYLVALFGATILVFTGIFPFNKVLSTIDWNVLLMIAGTMGTVSLFIWSKMPSLLSDKIINFMPNEK